MMRDSPISTEPRQSDLAWIERWFDAAAETSLSFRSLDAVKSGGGLDVVQAEAEAKGVHLLLFKDAQGADLVAVSRHPFVILC